jgi:3alpha(or 20beta)-hydroxysteroid dehydrogenase
VGRLEGRVALITGGARGQGEAEARLFCAEGAAVVVGDILDPAGEAVCASLGERAMYVHLDVTDEADWTRAVDSTLERFGGLDVLVNNAGILRFGSIRDTSLADYMRVVNVNQVGVFLGMRAVIPPMTRARRGSIVNCSSTEGMGGMAGLIAYSSAKWAVRGMSKTAAMELGSLGIRCNSIHPGGIDTEFVRDAGIDADLEPWARSLPLGRLGRSEEIARLALFLASDESSYCTGAEFVADGGLTAGIGVNPL